MSIQFLDLGKSLNKKCTSIETKIHKANLRIATYILHTADATFSRLIQLSQICAHYTNKNISYILNGCNHVACRMLNTVYLVARRIKEAVTFAWNASCHTLSLAFNAVKGSIARAAGLTANFIQKNWKRILCYLVAWSVILICSGVLYGFQAVAFPLSIGFAIGCGLGGIMGILTTTVLDPENHHNGINTAWGFLNSGIEKLNQNGTRQIVLSISVTVLLAAAVIFPYALGGVLGFVAGDQLATKIGFQQDLGHDSHDEATRTRRLESLQEQLSKLQEQIEDELRRNRT